MEQYSARPAECTRSLVFGPATEALHWVHSWSHGATTTPGLTVSAFISSQLDHVGAAIPTPALYRIDATSHSKGWNASSPGLGKAAGFRCRMLVVGIAAFHENGNAPLGWRRIGRLPKRKLIVVAGGPGKNDRRWRLG